MIRYGIDWDDNDSPVKIEMEMIRAGGFMEFDGVRYGEGLFHHYRELQCLLWPEDEDHHRWSDLMLKEILDNRITVMAGARDVGKTHIMARYALTDYFVFPHDTLILISSTDTRGLQLRIFGDMKDLLAKAKEKHPWLPGYAVESLLGIFSDQLEVGQKMVIRDMRKGIICFVAGTMVDTPNGPVEIENIKVGQTVLNAIGTGRVKAIGRSLGHRLVRVCISNGEIIYCTPDHLFFTARGWVKAVDLVTCDRVFSASETLSLLRSTTRTRVSQSQVLLENMPVLWPAQKMRSMQCVISSLEEADRRWSQRTFLQHCLRREMGCSTPSPQADTHKVVSWLRQTNDYSPSQSPVLFGIVPRSSKAVAMSTMRSSVYFTSTNIYKGKNSILQSFLQEEGNHAGLLEKLSENNGNRVDALEGIPTIYSAFPYQNRTKNQQQSQSGPLVSDRFGIPRNQTSNRSRWGYPSGADQGEARFDSNGYLTKSWVVGVEILEPPSAGRSAECQKGHPVYNLEVEGHPSYSVHGVIVHNCVPVCGGEGEQMEGLEKFCGVKQKRRRLLGDELQFCDASYLNTLANLDKGDFKGVFCGNFLGRGDPLDQLAEPKKGWGSVGDVKKTTVWDNLKGGRTVNLVGLDSPNFDYPQDKPSRYPYLIDRHDVERVKERYGDDSLQFWSQIMGVRKADLMAHRVLTVELCRKFGAFNTDNWENQDITSIYAMDAAFGGDRPVQGKIEFGRNVNGRWIIKCHKPETVKLRVSDQLSMEDQLALAMKEYCGIHNIPPQNVYYDAGMRATLPVAIGKLFSNEANAINFGGTATDRPVSADDYIYDEKEKKRRLKTCREAYSKFVTELNYSVRMVVEARQMREIPENVVREFEGREWCRVSGDRIELETKAETKKRIGFSPDLADWLAIAVEGARRRGFIIEGIKETGQPVDADDEDWLRKELDKFKTYEKRFQLKYGTK